MNVALDGIRVFTYGDMYKVPGSKMSLAEARARGGNVVIVYSFLDALKKASDGKESVFFAVGFETTQPTVAIHVVKRHIPNNLKLLIAYRLTPPIMKYILETKEVDLNGIIAPGHVSTIIGSLAWKFIPDKYNVPTVVAGFEPIDVLIAIYEILKQLKERKVRLVNEYFRAVKPHGNVYAKKVIFESMNIVDASWRGIGLVKKSGLELKNEFKKYDAVIEYSLSLKGGIDVKPGCRCADVILGKAKPTDCPLFGKVCTPARPYGPCMVSSEGTCNIWYRYGGSRVFKVFLN